jgi:hypothetical protein
MCMICMAIQSVVLRMVAKEVISDIMLLLCLLSDEVK